MEATRRFRHPLSDGAHVQDFASNMESNFPRSSTRSLDLCLPSDRGGRTWHSLARDVAKPDDQPVDHLQGIIWCRAEDVGRDVGRDVGDWVCPWHAKRLCDGVSYGLGWGLSYGLGWTIPTTPIDLPANPLSPR